MSLNVLLVEDVDFLRVLLAEAVASLGYVVTECPTADQALITFEEMDPFSLVITDIRMPGRLDGLDLAQAIWSRWPELPVIITSANTVLPSDFLPSNAKFLPKPVALSSLHWAIAELLSRPV